jgi:hypothetical protein
VPPAHTLAGSRRPPCPAVLPPAADSFHKPGFKGQARILHHLFTLLDTPVIKGPLWDATALGATAFASNGAYVRQQVAQLLSSSFPNLTQPQVRGAAVQLGALSAAFGARPWGFAVLPCPQAACTCAVLPGGRVWPGWCRCGGCAAASLPAGDGHRVGHVRVQGLFRLQAPHAGLPGADQAVCQHGTALASQGLLFGTLVRASPGLGGSGCVQRPQTASIRLVSRALPRAPALTPCAPTLRTPRCAGQRRPVCGGR